MNPPAARTLAPSARAALDVSTRGVVGADERDRVYAMISAVLARHRRAVDHTRVRLTGSNGVGGPALVQVNLRVCGAPARVQAAGRTTAEAITAAAARLQRQVHRLSTGWEPWPWPWPDPERRPLGVPGEAPIARLKSYRLHRGMPCQAAAMLNAMDYDVYLYTDTETGEDAIVHRAGPTGLCLARQRTMRPPSLPAALPLTINPRTTPILTPGQAATRLADAWLPFVFYTDHDSRRGSLLYRRYDGDLGLITPAAAEVVPAGAS